MLVRSKNHVFISMLSEFILETRPKSVFQLLRHFTLDCVCPSFIPFNITINILHVERHVIK